MNRTLLMSGLLVVAVLMMSVVVGLASTDDMKLTYVENYSMSNIIDLKVSGNHLYVTNDSNFNVFNINSNGLLSHVYTIENLIGDIAISGDYAYIAGANLTIVDITTPESPDTVGNYEGVNGGTIVVSGNYAYVAKYRDDLLVFDISDKTNPLLIGNCYVRQIGLSSDIASFGDYVYATNLSDLVIINVSNPTTPTVVKSYSMSGAPSSIALSNNNAYVASFLYGLEIFDVNDPLSVFIAGVNEIPVNAHHIAVSGNYAYIVNSPDGASLSQANDVTVINVSNPSAPLYVGNYTKGPSMWGTIWDLAVSDDYIYVNDVVDGVVVLHIGATTIAPVHNINKDIDYTAIQNAIDDASPGDEIHVDSGTYYENVNVNKQLILRGTDTGAGMPVVDAGVSGSAITLNANGIELDGFTAINANSSYAGIRVASSNNTLSGNTASNNGYGIILSSSSNNTLSDNTASNNSYSGIYLYSSSNNTLIGNTASNNVYGIILSSSNHNTVSGNTASNNEYGISLSFSNHNTVSGNTASNNEYGISLSFSNHNTLIGNTASNNSYSSIFLYSSSNNIFHHNNLVENTAENTYDNGNNQWDSGIEGNHYSDYAGTDSDGDGIGDIPYTIPGGSSVDNYPLMNPWGSTPTIGMVHNINKGTDYTTIQSAIDDASPGDEIHVDSGTYYENVNVYKRITLIGMGADVVTVQAADVGDHVFEVTADWVNISGFTVTGATDDWKAGIYLENSSTNIITNNTALDNNFGILLMYSSSGNTFADNNASNNEYGICLSSSSNNTLTKNLANSNNDGGIWLLDSSSNILVDNNASNNRFGIQIYSSSNNTLKENTMFGNSYNFEVSSSSLSHYNQNISMSNTVNGKPIYYWVDQQDQIIPSDAGFVGVVNSTNITVRDLILTNNKQGVLFANTNNSKIENVNVSNTYRGVYLYYSSNNTLSNNIASNNQDGISLWFSCNNTLQSNIAPDNNYGIYLYHSNNNTLQDNAANSNDNAGIRLDQSSNNLLIRNIMSNNIMTWMPHAWGIELLSSSDNLIYLNNFINNTNNAYPYNSINTWNSTSPITYTYKSTTYTNYLGNFWSDYTGADNFSGPNQDQTGSDGIGDTPYNIIGDAGAQDRYPLMAPSSLPPSDYEGKLLKQTGDSKVYLIEDGKKHHFTSPEALDWNGYSSNEVIEVPTDVINSFEPGADISITQAIIDKYNALGGAATFGLPAGTGEQTGYPDNAGVICTYVNFQSGAIEYFTNGDQAGNAYAILNPFLSKWASMDYANSVLGYPISDMSDVQTSKFGTEFRYQHFKNGDELGSLEYNITTGEVYEIHGAIYATWGALGYADSELGAVTSDERGAVASFKGTTGRVSDFENGHLHWHSSGDHYMVTYMTYGDLDALYVSMGGTDSWLGFPVMNQEDRGGYGYCEFEGGYIEWDAASGAYKAKNFGITDGLVAEWHFDEGSGNVLGDSSGNGNDGTIYGATWTTNGKFASALQFDGNDYIVIPDSPELSGGAGKNMTVEYWFYTNNQGAYIISKIRDVGYKDWSALIGGFGPGLNFWYENSGYDRRFFSGSVIEERVWHHGAFTFQRSTSGSNAVLKMYLDGNELPLTPFYQDGVPSNQLYDMPDTSAPVSIGYAGTYYGNLYFNGKIDEIRVFDRVLTAEEIKSEFDKGGSDNQIVISELLPENNSHLGSTSAQFSWRTNLESSSDLFIKRQDETSYSHYIGNTGTFHSITVDDLLRNTVYNFYVSSGSKESEVRNIFIDNGIEFIQKSYNFNIERDYSQQATVTVQNTDSEPHSLLVSLNNPYDDLIVGFIGDGSHDQEITLDSGEIRDVTLSIFAQDAMLSQYQLQIDLNSIDSNVNDHAVVNLNVRQPNVDFTVSEIETDPYTLTKTFQVTNNGDKITDFSIFAEDGLDDRVLFKPAIIHANMGTGESLTFKLVPLLESDTPITGFINATGAGHYERTAVDFSQSGGKTLFTSVLSDVTICMGTNSWYCTNKPNIKNTLSIPPGFDSSDVEGAVLAIDFSLPWSDSSYRNHNVDISLNGHLVKSLNGIVPNGLYLIPVDPSFLNYGSGGTGVNQIDINTKHLNGGHYVVATNIEFRLKLNQLTTKLFADSQEEADNVVKSLDILCDKCVPKTEITSVEPVPSQLEAIAGQDVTFDVNVNLKNVQDGALEVDVYKGDSLVTKSFRDVAGSPETTETFAISFQAPDVAGSHEYNILTRFREGASGELIDDSFCDVREQSSYKIIAKDHLKIIKGPKVHKLDSDGVMIIWETDKLSNSLVKYGKSPSSYEFTSSPFELDIYSIYHNVEIQNIDYQQTYYYKIISDDGHGLGNKVESEEYNFKFIASSQVDGYSFKNWQLTEETEKEMEKSIKASIDMQGLEHLIPIFNIFRTNINDKSQFGGHCYGMATTSILYFKYEIDKPNGFENIDTFKVPKEYAQENIEKYQINQVATKNYLIGLMRTTIETTGKAVYAKDIDEIYRIVYGTDFNGEQEFFKIADSIDLNEPLSITLIDVEAEHSVTPIGYTIRDNSGTIYIYDNNMPGQTHEIEFNPNRINFIDNPYSGYDFYKVISEEPNKNLDGINDILTRFGIFLKNKLGDIESYVLTLKCPADLRIVDQYGRVITTFNGETNEIPDAVLKSEEKLEIYNLPSHLEYTIEMIGTGIGEADLSFASKYIILTFDDIPITSLTRGKMYIGKTNSYILSLDNNNDGIIDEYITPMIDTYTENGYNISFSIPITTMNQFSLKDGSTLPIKFTARNSTTDDFIYDDTVNVTITNSTGHLITYFTNGTGTDNARINSDEEQYIVNFDTSNYDLDVGETYAITTTFGESDSLRGYAIAYFNLIDGTPPSSITNLHSISGTTWINWTWTNPPDFDFNHTEIYLNNIFQTNTSSEYFNATALNPGTEYTISTRTVDISGNVNQTWKNATATTLTVDTEPPVFDSVNHYPAVAYAGAVVNVSAIASDDSGVADVMIDGVPLSDQGEGIWIGSFVVPTDAAVGDHVMSLTADDTAGNSAETTLSCTVVNPVGGIAITSTPKPLMMTSGTSSVMNVKLVSSANFDDIVEVTLDTSGFPDAYAADLSCFNRTSVMVQVPAGQTVLVPFDVSMPAGVSGYKVFKDSARSLGLDATSMDTGVVYVT